MYSYRDDQFCKDFHRDSRDWGERDKMAISVTYKNDKLVRPWYIVRVKVRNCCISGFHIDTIRSEYTRLYYTIFVIKLIFVYNHTSITPAFLTLFSFFHLSPNYADVLMHIG